MPLVFPQQSGGFLNPSQFLGTYVNQDPSSYIEGNWWYRADIGTIYTYINGQVLPAISSTAIFIDSNATYTNTTFTEDVVILPGVTLTIYGNVTFLRNLIVLGTLQSSNPNASSTSTQNNNYTMYGMVYIQGIYSIAQYNNDNINTQSGSLTIYGQGTISGAGTLNISLNVTIHDVFTINGVTVNINSGYTLTVNNNITLVGGSLSGSGTLSISSGYTLTVNGNTTISVTTLNINANTLTINSGYTLTLNTNLTISTTTLTGSGTLTVNSGYTLTVNGNISLSISTVSGAGTLTVNSGYTLTQGANITISISTVNIKGTWANAGYTITVPSRTTVTFNQSGSLTTGSTAGTLTVNGTVYWYSGAIGTSTSSSGIPSFPLTINGSGIFVGSPVNGGTATTALSLSSTSLGAGSYTSTGQLGSGGNVYITLSTISGSAVGKYGLGYYDSKATSYFVWILVYIGTANTNFSVSGKWGAGQSDTSENAIFAFNSSGSAGTITLTGTLYA